VVLLLGFGFVPLLILAVIYFSFYFEGQKEAIRQVEKEIAERVSLGISSYLEKTTGQIRLLARLLPPEEKSRRDLHYLSYSILDQWIESDMITLMDLEGNEVSKVSRYYTFGRSEIENRALDPSFGAALRGKTYIGHVGICRSFSARVSAR
jgi:hypothetical protein